ncbi:hypothetical protein BDD14_0101 [Edaphobacter modestus]|uniref:EF-hand domain-containing protein n=1 Tax=Edaphobacter modestus TaxID=388466 RepID=A0A4Q7YN90_9BACT|nr:hypothetical protein BDD14_0101 [Edaphobacter modestus]
MGGSQHWKFRMLALVLAPAIFAAPGAPQVSVPRVHFPPAGAARGKVIIIGFVGGFVSQDDVKHPKVQFAAYPSRSLPAHRSCSVWEHHGRKALHEVVRMLDSDGDGVVAPNEKRESTIITYGHSWGAAETVPFAQALGQMGFPVALTIQIDTVAKPGSRGAIIPASVASAINFYQTRGPLHGLPEIVAADPKQTTILGNILMT